MRSGIGFDVHPFTDNKDLILGGIKIDQASRGLDGHSDADVALHALMDALLGAAGAGDIGDYFPPGDDRYKNISSRELLRQVREIVSEQGFNINNLDLVIITEKPRIKPYKAEMEEIIARILNLSQQQVNIKATTTEGLGFTGREEGIAAQAVVTLGE